MPANKTAAILLAAGKGKRMKSALPKVLHLISGEPLILKSLNILENLNFDQKVVVVGHQSEKVKEALKGKKVDFATQENQLGTADAVKAGLDKLNKEISTVIVLNGDDSAFYNPQTIKNLIGEHLNSSNALTFLTLDLENPEGLGRVIREHDVPIAVVEDKDASADQKKIQEINCGLYVFSRAWLDANIAKVKKSPVSQEYYLVDLIKLAVSQKQKVGTLKLENPDQWIGVNTPEDLAKANLKAQGGRGKIHFMGAAGAGQSAAAALSLLYGYDISACDTNPDSSYSKNLEFKIEKGHDKNHLDGVTALVISPAVSLLDPNNPELSEARKNNIPVYSWQEFIGKFLQKDKFVITVAGGYGKSTTTAMVSKILEDAGFDPSCIVGARLIDWDQNFRFGSSKYFVCEADEYNNNFLNYKSDIAVVLNIAWDHPDFFKTEKDVEESFKKFINNIKPNGTLVIADNPKLESLCKSARSDIRLVKVKDFGSYSLSIIGDFRKENADAALTVASELKIAEALAKKSVESFKGLGRRLELKGTVGGAKVYDDYAVQPYTVKSTTSALKEKFKSDRLLLVFEPHTFSRINTFFDSFVSSLREAGANQIYITDVFPAREKGDRATLSKKLAKAVGSNSQYTGNIETTAKALAANLKNFDVILTMGAGDVYKIYDLIKDN